MANQMRTFAPCSAAEARSICQLAEKRGDYVRPTSDGGPDEEPERPRLGRPHRLDLSRRSFQAVLCVRRLVDAHSGVLELQALVLLVCWLLRSRRKQRHRVVILGDAKRDTLKHSSHVPTTANTSNPHATALCEATDLRTQVATTAARLQLTIIGSHQAGWQTDATKSLRQHNTWL